MSNINAAIGRQQLATFEDRVNHRRALGRAYDEVLLDVPGVEVLPNDYAEVVPHIYVIRLVDTSTRNHVKERLLSVLGVETALHYFPNHLLAKYRGASLPLPVTEDAFSRMLTIPLHMKVREEDATLIATVIRDSVLRPLE